MTNLIKTALSVAIIAVVIASMPANAFFGSKNESKKPKSKIEFTIGKHSNLHIVDGGFKSVEVKGNKVKVDIKSLWTWQNDSKASDDPKRTADLLSDDWFNADKFRFAYFTATEEKSNGDIHGVLKIKNIEKKVVLKKDGKVLKLRIKLSDFNIDNSWKRVFASGHADVVIKR